MEQEEELLRLKKLGKYALECQDLEAAKKCFEQALAINPSEPELYHELGKIAKFCRDINGAEHYYLKAIQLDPNPLFKYNYAIFLKESHQPDASAELLREIINSDTTDEVVTFWSHYYLAAYHNDQSEKLNTSFHEEKVFFHYETLLEMNLRKFSEEKLSLQTLSYIYARLGVASYNLGLYEQSVQYLDRCLNFESQDQLQCVYSYKGFSYIELKRWDLAETYLKRYLDEIGFFPRVAINYSFVLYELEKFEEVINFLTPILDKFPSDYRNNATFRLGSAYFELKDYKKSLSYYETYKASVPEDPYIHTTLADVYVCLNMRDKAIESINKAIILGYADPEIFSILEKLTSLED